MKNKLYLKLQMLGYDADEKPGQDNTNALKDFCKALRVKVHNHEFFHDTFYVILPDEEFDACMVINAIVAYCHFHNIAHRLASEKVTVPLNEFLKVLKNEGL